MTVLPVADFAPDAVPYLSTAHPVMAGTYPRADGADGPLQGPAIYSDALPGRVRGAFAARDRFGASYLVAGTASGLYLLDGRNWQPRGSGYTVPDGAQWSFAQFGQQVLATNGFDPIQAWTLGTSADFAVLSATAPRLRYLATIEPGFAFGGYYDAGEGVVGNGLWWSGLNDATLWPTPGTLAATSVQSDVQPLAAGGFVTGILPAIGGAQGVIFTERALYRLEYIGPPQIFAFREVDRSRGCICPYGIAQVGGLAFFISEDGFCLFDGASVQNIGLGRVDRYFLTSVDMEQLDRVTATVDLDRKLVVWAYPTPGAAHPNRWLIYSYAVNRWRPCDDPAMVAAILFPARTPAVDLDQPDAFPDDLEAPGAPSLDSPLYQGGRRLLAGFDAANRLVTYNGPNLAARLETGDTDAQGRRVFVTGIRPLTDAAQVLAGVGAREGLAQPPIYSPTTPMAADGRCPQRATGRFVRGVIEIPAGQEWTYLQGGDFQFRPEGLR